MSAAFNYISSRLCGISTPQEDWKKEIIPILEKQQDISGLASIIKYIKEINTYELSKVDNAKFREKLGIQTSNTVTSLRSPLRTPINSLDQLSRDRLSSGMSQFDYSSLKTIEERILDLKLQISNPGQSEVEKSKALRKCQELKEWLEIKLEAIEHPFHNILSIFSKKFCSSYEKVLDEYKDTIIQYANKKQSRDLDTKFEAFNKKCEQATTEVQKFMKILYLIIAKFYNFKCLRREEGLLDYVLTEENVVLFLTTAVFKGKVHQLIFQLYENQNLRLKMSYEENLKTIRKITLTNLGLEKNTENSTPENSLPKEAAKYLSPMEYHDYLQSIYARDKEWEEQISLKKRSFEKAAIRLRGLEDSNNPIKKLAMFHSVIEMVESFSGGPINTSNSAEVTVKCKPFIRSLLYVAAKSELWKFTIHMKVVVNFIPKEFRLKKVLESEAYMENLMNCLCELELTYIGDKDKAKFHEQYRVEYLALLGDIRTIGQSRNHTVNNMEIN